jgi:hypothetical protein
MISGSEALGVEEALRRPVCKSVGSGLQRMTIVTSEPSPLNAKLGIETHQLGPQVPVSQGRTASVPPSLILPAKDETTHAADQEFGVGIQLDPRSSWHRTQCLDRR